MRNYRLKPEAMAKTLNLTLKNEFFDMIASGIKKIEYREIKDHWVKILMPKDHHSPSGKYTGTTIGFLLLNEDVSIDQMAFCFHEYENVKFFRGWACSEKYKNMTVEFKGIDIGEPNPEWSGGMTGAMFRIHLGNILEIKEGTKTISK